MVKIARPVLPKQTQQRKTLGQELTKDGQEILSQGENKIRWKIKMKTLLHTPSLGLSD